MDIKHPISAQTIIQLYSFNITIIHIIINQLFNHNHHSTIIIIIHPQSSIRIPSMEKTCILFYIFKNQHNSTQQGHTYSFCSWTPYHQLQTKSTRNEIPLTLVACFKNPKVPTSIFTGFSCAYSSTHQTRSDRRVLYVETKTITHRSV